MAEVGGGLVDAVLGAAGVDEVTGAVLSPDVEDLAAGEPSGALGQPVVACGEDEGGLLHGVPATGLHADGPALGGARVLFLGQPVGGVRDAEDGPARGLSRVEDVVGDLDDAVVLRCQQQPGGGEVQHRVQERPAALSLAGGEHHVAGGGRLADDHLGAGAVPAPGGGRSEHAVGAGPREDQGARDEAGQYGAKGARGALVGAGGRGPEECRHHASLREGVRVQVVAPRCHESVLLPVSDRAAPGAAAAGVPYRTPDAGPAPYYACRFRGVAGRVG